MQQLSIAKGTIYYYFRWKEELLDAVLDHIDLWRRIEKLITNHDKRKVRT